MPYVGSNSGLADQQGGGSGGSGGRYVGRKKQNTLPMGIVGATLGGRAAWAPGSSGSGGTARTEEAQKEAEKIAEMRRKAVIMDHVEQYMTRGGLSYDQAVDRVAKNLMFSSSKPFKDRTAARDYIHESWGSKPAHPGASQSTYERIPGISDTAVESPHHSSMPAWERAMRGLASSTPSSPDEPAGVRGEGVQYGSQDPTGSLISPPPASPQRVVQDPYRPSLSPAPQPIPQQDYRPVATMRPGPAPTFGGPGSGSRMDNLLTGTGEGLRNAGNFMGRQAIKAGNYINDHTGDLADWVTPPGTTSIGDFYDWANRKGQSLMDYLLK